MAASRHTRPFTILATVLLAASLAEGRPPVAPRAVLDRRDYSDMNLAAAFSPDGKTLATGGPPHSLKLWDVTAGKLKADRGSFVNPDAPSVRDLAWSPDGKSLAIGINDSPEVQLWGPTADKPRRVLKGHARHVLAVRYSPDGSVLASSSADGTVRLWAPSTGKPHRVLRGHRQWASALVFSPDGKTLYSGSGGGEIHVWDVRTGDKLRSLKGHKKGIDCLSLSRDGKLLLSSSLDAGIRVWDVKAGEEKTAIDVGGRHAVLTADGKHVIAARGRFLRVWSAADGKEVAYHRHPGYPQTSALLLSPDGKVLAHIAADSLVMLWDVAALLRPEK